MRYLGILAVAMMTMNVFGSDRSTSDDKRTKRNPRSDSRLAYHLESHRFIEAPLNAPGNGIPLSEYLWAQTASYRNAALNSGFVQGLKNATLDPEAFGNYMIQDSLFCYWVKNIIDLALKNATDPAVWNFLSATGESYKSYYESMFETWSIANAPGVKSGPALSRYLNQVRNVATTMDPIYVVVALIPCAKLWPWLGDQLNVNSSSFGVYDSWVKTNFGYSSEYKTYETLINNAETWGHIDRHRALEAYRGSMSGEADFFNIVKTV